MNVSLITSNDISKSQEATVSCQNRKYTNSKPYVITIQEPLQDEPFIAISYDHKAEVNNISLKSFIALLRLIGQKDTITMLEENIYVLPFMSDRMKALINDITMLAKTMGTIKE